MSTHPNALLICRFTPDDLVRKTYRAILSDSGIDMEADDYEDDDINISGEDYHHFVAEEDYDSGWQISAPEGSIVVFNLITYGYGKDVEWDVLVKQKDELEARAKTVAEKHHCKYRISVSANYW